MLPRRDEQARRLHRGATAASLLSSVNDAPKRHSEAHYLVRVLLGTPPARGASPLESLRWIRGLYVRILPLWIVVAVAPVAVFGGRWIWVWPVAVVVWWIGAVVTLTVSIRRRQRRQPSPEIER